MTETTNNTHINPLHFGWFVGHAITVATGLAFFLSFALFHPNTYFYRLAYLASVASYSITLFNAYSPAFKKNDFNFKRILLDENTQYLLIALYFLWTKRIAVSLVPFFVYSLFHVAQFTQGHLIPAFAPHAASLGDKLKALADQNYSVSMHLVAKYEIFVVMGRLVLGLFIFKSTIFSVLLFGHFIRMRFYTSSYMRDTFHFLGEKLDQYLLPENAHPKLPPVITQYYQTFREVQHAKQQK
ncbi:hypothetical protein BJ944DRAFT_253275 [Cunninghamella echinulata]|nr:hypothetical protein BJ944DRAFT_253275 [Cunninghamella echinulata]